jgi:hypothetical protein
MEVKNVSKDRLSVTGFCASASSKTRFSHSRARENVVSCRVSLNGFPVRVLRSADYSAAESRRRIPPWLPKGGYRGL